MSKRKKDFVEDSKKALLSAATSFKNSILNVIEELKTEQIPKRKKIGGIDIEKIEKECKRKKKSTETFKSEIIIAGKHKPKKNKKTMDYSSLVSIADIDRFLLKSGIKIEKMSDSEKKKRYNQLMNSIVNSNKKIYKI